MSIFPAHLREKAATLLARCTPDATTIATAESCTGGLLSGLLTELPGASAMFTHGFITYANRAKQEMVGVPHALLAQHGAVSEAVARAMAEGALKAARTTHAIAITGIAGPDGGSARKPVGTVHLALASRDGATTHQHKIFAGDRSEVRMQAVEVALEMLLDAVKK